MVRSKRLNGTEWFGVLQISFVCSKKVRSGLEKKSKRHKVVQSKYIKGNGWLGVLQTIFLLKIGSDWYRVA